MSTIKEMRQICQNFSEIYSKYFSSLISIYITKLIAMTAITPNQVTIAMTFVGMIGGILFVFGDNLLFVIGSLCFVFLNILDCVDGELARYKNRCSEFGKYLDAIGHYIIDSFMLLGCAVGLFNLHNSWLLFYFAVVAHLACLFDELLRDILYQVQLESAESDRLISIKRQLSFKKKNVLGVILSLVATNVGFFHMFFICSLADLLIPKVPLGIISLDLKSGYMIIFCILSVIKFFARFAQIYNSYFRESKNYENL